MERHVDCPHCGDKAELNSPYGILVTKGGKEYGGVRGYFYLCYRCLVAFVNDECDEATLDQIGTIAARRARTEAKTLGSYNNWSFKPDRMWLANHPGVTAKMNE
jgi:hypothetical protein